MKRLFTAMIIAIAATVAAFAQDNDTREILKINEDFSGAYMKKDISFFERVLSDDYTFSGPDGKAKNKTQVLDELRAEAAKPTYKPIEEKSIDPKVRVIGNTAILTADWTSLSSSMADGAEPHRDNGRYTSIYEKRNGKWMIVAEHVSEAQHDRKLMEQQVMKMGLAYGEIIKRQDVAAVERLYADNYMFTNERGQVKNKAQDIEQWKTKPAKFERFDISDQQVRVIGNNVAIETGTVTFKGTGHDGKAFEGSERFTTTWVWRGGRWQVVADHVSTIAK